MPLKSEAGCVLTPADKYDGFRRENCAAKVSGKCLDHIFGITGDGTELHSLRYRFSVGWTNDSAKSHCSSRSGTFESGSEEESMTNDQQRGRFKYMSGNFIRKAMDEASGVPLMRYLFTSENMDEGGDIITRDATEKATERWRQWRNIRFQHNPDRPIGKAVRIGKADGLDWNEMDVRIDDPDIKPLTEGDDPVLAGASVGINVNEFSINEDEEAVSRSFWGEPWIITDYDFVEISLVDHPMNYDAKRVGAVQQGRSRVLFRMRDFEPEATESAPPENETISMSGVSGDTTDSVTVTYIVPEESPDDAPTDKENRMNEQEELDTEALVPEVELELPETSTPQEGGDPDPALMALDEIKDMLTEMGMQIGAIHKAFVETAEEEEDQEDPEVEEAAEVEEDPLAEEVTEPVDAEEEEPQAEPAPLADLYQMVTQIHKHLFGDEAEDAEVEGADQPDIEKLVEQKVAAEMEKRSKLTPRQSAAVDPDSEKPVDSDDDEFKNLNPRDALRLRVARSVRSNQQE